MLHRHPLTYTAGVLAVSLVWASALSAQGSPACTVATASDGPTRQVFTCGAALTFEREPSAALRILERADDPAPRSIELEGGAILIQVTPGSQPTRIRTPHAIATVRGTTYIVDATDDQTSIFVIEGAVSVRRTNDASTVTLRAGDGVDARTDTPLEVRQWPANRAATLLSRFGR